MHFVLQTPPLQHLALAKIVAHLWSQGGIFTSPTEVRSKPIPNKFSNEWLRIEREVKKRVCGLPLPETCKKELVNLVEPLGAEIYKWCDYHGFYQLLDSDNNNFLAGHFCWTMHGTIDYAATAEKIVGDERVAVERRYEMACLNCLEDDAGRLLQFVPADRRREFMNYVGLYDHNDNNNYYSMEDRRHILILYFTHVLSGQVERWNESYYTSRISRGTDSINKYLFRVVRYVSPRATWEYCFRKLSHGEKHRALVEPCGWLYIRRFSPQTPTCKFLYALTLLNEEQVRSEVFPKYSHKILWELLNWPMQSLFMAFAAECGWGHVKEKEREQVLAEIIFKVGRSQDYDYARLFWQCWRRLCSADCKLRFLSNVDHLRRMMLTKREEFITLVLGDAPSQLLQRLLHDDRKVSRVLMDGEAIGDEALMECKEKAALESSNHPGDEQKRLRKECVSGLVDRVMESRRKK